MTPTVFLDRLRRHGLSVGGAQILLHLAETGEPVALGVMAKRIGISGAAVTSLRDSLTALGYVHTPVFRQDRRKRRVSITEKGKDAAISILRP